MDAFDGFKVLVATLCMTAATAAFDQTSGERGSIPPGQSKDGAAPADGAIKGGSILPGEQSGVPEQAKSQARCDELLGTLREDCLKQQREAAGRGATRDPAGTTEPSDSRTRSPERAD